METIILFQLFLCFRKEKMFQWRGAIDERVNHNV